MYPSQAESRINYPAIGILTLAWIVIAVFSILKGRQCVCVCVCVCVCMKERER